MDVANIDKDNRHHFFIIGEIKTFPEALEERVANIHCLLTFKKQADQKERGTAKIIMGKTI